MEKEKQRRLSIFVGVFLVLVSVTAVGIVVFSGDVGTFAERTVLVVQAGMVFTAGVLDVVAGFDTRITEHVAWYKIAGLGNVFLGLSLPFGLVGTSETLPLILTVVGGLLFVGMGIDMLIFDGRHVYSEPLGETDS